MQRLDFTKYTQVKRKLPPHALAACSDLILKAGIYKEEDKKYGRTYWLGILKRYSVKHKKEPAEMFTLLEGLLKDLAKMDKKYPKGNTLTNKLK